jgi:hypothetical protein
MTDPKDDASIDPANPWAWVAKMWNPLGLDLGAMAGMSGLSGSSASAAGTGMGHLASMFQPTLDPAEIDRKLADLAIVEQWLKLNLNFMQMSRQALEMQKAAVESIRDTAKAASDAAEKLRKR